MSKCTKRLLRVSLAVAGMAVLCASYAGTAAAAPSAPDPNVSDSVSGGDAANDATGGTKAPERSKVTDSKLLHNDVLSATIPKIKGTSYEASGLWVMPARDPGDNEDEDGLCHGTGGTQKMPGEHGKFQHPCQTSGNDIGSHGHLNGMPFAVPASAEIPGTDQGTGDATQSGDAAAPLSDPGAVTKELTRAPKGDQSLNRLSGHHLAVTPA